MLTSVNVVWEEAAADDRRIKDEKIQQHLKVVEEIEARKAEIRKAGVSPVPGGSL